MFDEVQTDLSEVEATVDMGGFDVDQAFGADRLGEARQEAHGKRRRFAMRAGKQFLIERRQGKRHRADLADGWAGVNCREEPVMAELSADHPACAPACSPCLPGRELRL